jgi:hypothetical protein
MRNISIVSRVPLSLPADDSGDLSTSTIDLDDGTVFVASEAQETPGEIAIKIWKLVPEVPGLLLLYQLVLLWLVVYHT